MAEELKSGNADGRANPQLAPDFLEILACPEDKSPVRQADQVTVDAINQKILGGKLLNRGGGKVTEQVDGGLIREDGKYFYPIRDGIPVLLIDEAILLQEE